MAFPLQGDDTYQSIAPTPLPEPYWVGFSSSLGRELGVALNEYGLPTDPLWLSVLSGNALATKKHTFSKYEYGFSSDMGSLIVFKILSIRL